MFAKNLRYLRNKNGLEQLQLAQKIGRKSASTISEWEKGLYTPPVGVISDLAAIFGVTMEDLMRKDLTGTNVAKMPIAIDSYNFFDAGIAAGQLETVDPFFADTVEQIELPSAIMGRYAGSEDIFVSRVNGESMNKVLPDQSLIAIKKFDDVEELKDRDIVVFKDGEDYSVKRFFNRKDAGVYLFKPESNNEEFQDIIIRYESASELEIVGKVVVYVVEL